jgi:hypothetical protein
MSSTQSVGGAPVPPTQNTTISDQPVPATAGVTTDNLGRSDALVVMSGNDQLILPEGLEEQPAIETPENFKKKKSAFSAENLPDYYALLAFQQKKDIEQKRDNMEARQKSTQSLQEVQKKTNQEVDKKMTDQAESQSKSNAKSGFLSVFSRIFSAVTLLVGAVLMAVPGLQPLGIALMITSAISLATSFPAVMEGLGKVFTAILKPFGEEFAKKWGPIFAAAYVAIVQITIMFTVPNPAAMLGAAQKIMQGILTGAQISQALVSGGVGMAIGVNNLGLADITYALDMLTSNADLFQTQFNQLLDALTSEYDNMSQNVKRYVQQIDDTPKISIA